MVSGQVILSLSQTSSWFRVSEEVTTWLMWVLPAGKKLIWETTFSLYLHSWHMLCLHNSVFLAISGEWTPFTKTWIGITDCPPYSKWWGWIYYLIGYIPGVWKDSSKIEKCTKHLTFNSTKCNFLSNSIWSFYFVKNFWEFPLSLLLE